MTDLATPNLPSRDFDSTLSFYGRLGFAAAYRDEGWLILRRDGVQLEFFPAPDVDPLSSSFMCCLRVDELDEWYERLVEAGVPETTTGFPRRHPPRIEPWGGSVAFLVDPDGTQLTLIQNR
ncbi:bleomycin resistance protein [Microbacterium oleivorans]|uniref:bleomycin resistance protein n=1 Tax=Microbacterium TaxID=33882 RepID=UPI00204158A7|nr:bleomycin resistance protein [Microbacterium oleivorans]MCM3696299.1 bleomycin resistance protein [Microbacterium oleivorans]